MSQTESGVAEQMVQMSIRAMESLSRMLASGAKNLAVFLFAVAKGTKQYRGITGVRNLLDGGHELVTLELDREELRGFCLHAKKNDIPCTVIHDRKLYQDAVPVLVRKTDAERINRVVEKMRLQHLPEDRGGRASSEPAGRGGRTAEGASENPTTGRRDSRSRPRSRFRPSGRASDAKDNTVSISPSSLRPSVRARISEMRRERPEARTPDTRQYAPPSPLLSAQQQPQLPVQPSGQVPAWNRYDDRMMEAVRQLLLVLTAVTQETTHPPVRESDRQGEPVAERQQSARRQDTQRQDTRRSTTGEPSRITGEPSRTADAAAFGSPSPEPRPSARDRVAQARSVRADRPAQGPAAKARLTGRGGR